MNQRIIPEFQTEAEEARWWFEHDGELTGDFAQARQQGTLTDSTAIRQLDPATTNIILDLQDADLARAQAAQRGLEYQAYLKLLIHEAVAKASGQQS